MLWIKSLHIVFVVSLFAGVFYLPRILVNLAQIPQPNSSDATPGTQAEHARLLLMAQKLYRFTNILAVPAVLFGIALWLHYGIGRGPGNGWMHAKLFSVVLLFGYLGACGSLLRKFVAGRNTRSHVWLRWFNEVPVVLLLLITVLVVVKPF